jgi:hypothetical protein
MIRDLNQADYQELARVWRSSSSSTEAHQRLMASDSFPKYLRTHNMRGGVKGPHAITLGRLSAIVCALRDYRGVNLPRRTTEVVAEGHLDFSKI